MAYQSNLGRFAQLDAQVLGMSVDSVFSHIAWQKYEVGKLGYPVGSDFFPHGEVARKYGILREKEPLAGINERAVFIIDKSGKLAFFKQYELGELPDVEECFEVLSRLQKQE